MSATYPIVAVAGATLVTAAARLRTNKPVTASLFLGGGIAAFLASIAHGFVPDLINGIATIVILATVLGNGYTLVKPLRSLIN